MQEAGIPQKHADAIATAQKQTLDEMVAVKESATKGDLRETELRLQKEIRDAELRLLRWQIGGWVALAAIMAKGFGWIGF